MGSMALLSMVLIMSLSLPGPVLSCPQLCACYFPTEVHCTFRSLTTVPVGISKHVERINLGFNSIQSVSETSFSGLDKLELLMLHGNDIQMIPDRAFRDLHSLQVLKMSYNKVDVITGKTFRGLRSVLRLHADHNRIRFIHPGAFYGLTSLKLLHLEGNRLGRLHPRTFVTFSFLQYFDVSSIKHLYLSDNSIRSLPHRMFRSMPQLESIYLHGNPWECDCRLRWLMDWEKEAGGPVKCKKDRTYASGHLCSVCSKPEHLAGTELSKLRASDVECRKPSIRSPLKKLSNVTGTGWREEVETEDLAEPDYRPLTGEVAMNLTDRHGGNRVELRCQVTGPEEPGTQTRWELPGNGAVAVRVSVNLTVELVCAVDWEQLSRVWTLIAYYSEEVPLTLRRVDMTESGARYWQDEGTDYRTGGVKADLLARPAWLMQPSMAMRLDRRRTTGNHAVLSLATSLYRRFTGAGDDLELVKRPWVLIGETLTEHVVLPGAMLRLNCPAVTPTSSSSTSSSTDSGDGQPSVEWTLPDGTAVRAPYVTADNRLSATATGLLTIRAVDGRDSGPYRCTRRVEGDWDSVTYRVAVLSLESEPTSRAERPVMVRARPGEAVSLPCAALAVPEARLSWLLPDNRVVSAPNGTLEVEAGLRGGRYTCVAVNRYGADSFSVRLLVDKPIRPSRVSGPRVLVRPVPREREGSGGEEAAAVFGEVRAQRRGSTRRLHRRPGGNLKPRPRFRPRPRPDPRPGNSSRLRAAEGRRRAVLRGQDGPEGSGEVGLGERPLGGGGHDTRVITKPAGHSNQRARQRPVAFPGATTHPTSLTGAATTIAATNKDTTGLIKPPTTVTGTSTSVTGVFTITTGTTRPATTSAETSTGIIGAGTTGTTTGGMTSVTDAPTPTPEVATEPRVTTAEALAGLGLSGTTSAQTLTSPTPSTTKASAAVAGAKETTAAAADAMATPQLRLRITAASAEPTGPSVSPPALTATLRPAARGNGARRLPRKRLPGHRRYRPNRYRHRPRFRPAARRTPAPPLGTIGTSATAEPGTASTAMVTVGRETQGVRAQPGRESPSVPPSSSDPPHPVTGSSTANLTSTAMTAPSFTATSRPATANGSRGRPPSEAQSTAKGVVANVSEPQSRPFPSSPTEPQRRPHPSQVSPGGRALGTARPAPLPRSVTSPEAPLKSNGSTGFAAGGITGPPWHAGPTAVTSLPHGTGDPETEGVDPPFPPNTSTAPTRELPVIGGGLGGAAPTREGQTGSTRGPELTPGTKSETDPAPGTTVPEIVTGRAATNPHRQIPGTGITPHPLTTSPNAGTRGDPETTHPLTGHPPASDAHTDQGERRRGASQIPPTFGREDMSTTSRPVPSLSAPRESSPRPHAPKESSPRPHAPKESSPRPHAPEKSSPKESSLEPSSPKESSLEPSSPKESSLEPSTPKESSLEPSTPKASSLEPSSPNENSLEPSSPRESSLEPSSPNENSLEPSSHKESSLETSSPRESSLEPSSPRESSPRPHSPKESSPKESSTSSHFPKESSLIESYPGPSSPRETSPRPHSPKESSPRDSSPGPTSPRESSPKESPPRPSPPRESPAITISPTRNTLPPSAVATATTHLYRVTLLNRKPPRFPTIPQVRESMAHKSSRGSQPLPGLRAAAKGKPKITSRHLHTVSVQAGKDARLPCSATGEPKPWISWTKVPTGAAMTANTKTQRFKVLPDGSFAIRAVELQDRGQFLCAARNQHGVDKALVTLVVLSQPPRVTVPRHREAAVYLGATFTADCRGEGLPPPRISWLLPDGAMLWAPSPRQAGHSAVVLANGTLGVTEITFSNRGLYKCVADNGAGVDLATVRLHVSALPPIIGQSKVENVSVPTGRGVHVDCTAKAAPAPKIRWTLPDGTQIKPSQFINGNIFVFPNGTLYIRNATSAHSGHYQCLATNLVGLARRGVSVRVETPLAPARIMAPSPHRVDVAYGSPLHLDCEATGDPHPKILWRLPTMKLVDSRYSHDDRIKVFTNGTLSIGVATDKDRGDYLCVARNQMGDDFLVQRVGVAMAPAKIRHKSETARQQVTYGKDLRVDCEASGLPDPQVSWGLPDGTTVNSLAGRSRRYVVFGNGSLYFNEAGPKDEGEYTCYAVNQIGKDEMRVSVKVVSEPPTIRGDEGPAVLEVPYGESFSLRCEAKGQPQPWLAWFSPFNRYIPPSSAKYRVGNDGTLLVRDGQNTDSGNYTCVARNAAGEGRRVVTVRVRAEPPRIVVADRRLFSGAVTETVLAGARKLIDCQAEGVPSPRVTWLLPGGAPATLTSHRDGGRVTVHANGTLDIRNAGRMDAGRLMCLASNKAGNAKLTVELEVVEEKPAVKPSFADSPSSAGVISAATGGSTVRLDCSSRGSPAPDTVWYLPSGERLASGQRLGKAHHGANGELHISQPTAAEAGKYRCVARNVAGSAERLVTLEISQEPEPRSHYSGLVRVLNGENMRLDCAVGGGRGHARVTWILPSGTVLSRPQSLGRFSLLRNGSLAVRHASVYDRGTYLCRASEGPGAPHARVPVIVVAYPPRITTGPAPVTYARRGGGAVRLDCAATGTPPAEVSWELPGQGRVTSANRGRLVGNKYLHPQGALVIQSPTSGDTGFYRCIATNLLGSDVKTTYVHVF
eukprot:gi/632981692/ref/XP_007907731.1/ PREDICTED: LOW QUALITY PROTEIN: matrix-remodeling-associated protein 5 [Callorhinchus milii]